MPNPTVTHFVSYASANERRVRALLCMHDSQFWKSCFLAPLSLHVGDAFPVHIEHAIAECSVFHLFWSEEASQSPWVAREIELALARWQALGNADGFLRCFRLDACEVLEAVKSRVHVVDVSPAFDARKPDAQKIFVSKLPRTGASCFGRDAHLDRLDAALDHPDVRVISFIAMGGQGKSTLINEWNKRLARHNYRGMRRVYAWSFYSQGSSEAKQSSADTFIAHALSWFGGPSEDPTKGSVWEKGERLANYVQAEPTLLILDGLEPLQHPPGESVGRIRDPGLETLLKELAANNSGLCVLTSRLRVTDLDEYAGAEGTHVAIDLEQLSTEAGRELLRARKVLGDDDELEKAVHEFGGYALALHLLGSYLTEFCDGDIRKRTEIPALTDATEGGAHAKRVMASYERMLGESAELSLLMTLGLFDRPASRDALDALRAEPPLLEGLTGRKRKTALLRLRHAELVSIDEASGVLDAHPLVREYFGSRLKERNLAIWTEGHRRLYQHYKRAAPDLPDTLQQMEPLFAAIVHGCAAGLQRQAFEEVLLLRIERRENHYITRNLGAFPALLACLASFFEHAWTSTAAGLPFSYESWLLNEAGMALRALGRPREAIQPMEAGLRIDVSHRDWKNASKAAENLSQFQMVLGHLNHAEATARGAVEYADQSEDTFQQSTSRAALADALHQLGNLNDANRLFDDAETIGRQVDPKYRWLYSSRGAKYCDLLLALNKPLEVAHRASETMTWMANQRWLLDTALDHLSLGRANLALGKRELGSRLLNQAVEGIRAAGTFHHLVRGLVARAQLSRTVGDTALAHRDLDEARKIIKRSGFRLFEADLALEEARLALAENKRDDARAALARGRALVDEMGYGRRKPEVAALELELGG